MKLTMQMTLEEFSSAINRGINSYEVGEYLVEKDGDNRWYAFEVLSTTDGYNRDELKIGSRIPIQIV